jgi:PAS domain S-box-containing protein
MDRATQTPGNAQEGAEALARERDLLRAENEALRRQLTEERGGRGSRETGADAARQRLLDALVELSANDNGAAEATLEARLRLSLEQLQATTEALDDANRALAALNETLQDQVAARTAELTGANAALREREQWLRLILEGATDYAIFAMDAGGRVAEWNSGAERLLGFTAEEMVGRYPTGMWMAEDLAARQPELEMCAAVEHGHAADNRWHLRKDGSRFWAAGVMTPLLDGDGELRGFLKILRDCTASHEAEERKKVLLEELNHRVKNTLAVVQSVAAQTLRGAEVPREVQSSLMSRLAALARSHDLLTRNEWDGASLQDAIGLVLAPHAPVAGAARITLAGPAVRLPPSAVPTVNLALHELATNALKYGALSVPEGRIDVVWTILPRQPKEEPVVEIAWRERGGPPVRPPPRRGFGSRLIENGLAHEFGTQVVLNFAPQGVECCIRLPLAGAKHGGSTR